MTTYIIVSERVGTPGEPFHPEEGANIDALLEFGFIKQAGKKSAKMTGDDSEQENQ